MMLSYTRSLVVNVCLAVNRSCVFNLLTASLKHTPYSWLLYWYVHALELTCVRIWHKKTFVLQRLFSMCRGLSTPAYFASLLTTAKSRGSRSRSADRGDMFIPRTRLMLGERAFSVAAPRQWNRLPSEMRCISNTERFKRHLKTFLFKSAFSDCWHLKTV